MERLERFQFKWNIVEMLQSALISRSSNKNVSRTTAVLKCHYCDKGQIKPKCNKLKGNKGMRLEVGK